MKRKDAYEVNDDFFDLSLSSPALKIRRLDAELVPIIDEKETLDTEVFGQSMPLQDIFVEQSAGSSPIPSNDLSCGSVPVNEERAIVLFNPMQSPPAFSISVDSDFLSGVKNPVIWSNGLKAPKSLLNETQKPDDDSGLSNRCLSVVPWVPTHSQQPPTQEAEDPGTQVNEMMDADDMDVEDNYNYNTQQIANDVSGATNGCEGWNQWQQHCMIQQPPNNLLTPITWFGRRA